MHPRPTIRSERLLDRFLRYVRIGTAADPHATTYPSSSGQLQLGALLAQELTELGIETHQDSHGLVWATVPASIPGDLPTILFNAHLDTSPEAPGDNVQPSVIESYSGGDIPLARQGCIRVAETPVLQALQGHTLVTTDGRTLLGGDDKAGVAAIMELAAHLIENPHLPHGPVRILFTCDEEIGHGARFMDLRKANASAGYTLDGGGEGIVDNANFSADSITLTVQGYNIHPAIAKDTMINAVRGLAAILSELPSDSLSPETTSEQEGFLHPYEVSGGVGRATAEFLLRDFTTQQLDVYAQLLQDAAQRVCERMPGLRVEFNRKAQYRNMADTLRTVPHVVELALEAHRQLGQVPRVEAIRGGTDGAMFSALGLPTPNLSVGQHNIHSVLEFASLNQMVYAVEHAVELLRLWSTHCRS